MLKETMSRATAKTPRYFKKAQKYGAALVASAIAVKALNLGFPEWLEVGANYAIAIGTAVMIFAQTVTTKSSE